MVDEMREDKREGHDEDQPIEQDAGETKEQGLSEIPSEAVPELPAADPGDEVLLGDASSASDSQRDSLPSNAAAPAESYARVTQIEVPADIHIPAAPPPGVRDRHGIELPLPRAGAQEEEPVDDIFPPELRRPLPPREEPAEGEAREPAAEEEIGRPLPQIVVMVTLADARAEMQEVVDIAAERQAPRFERLADEKIRHAFWVKRCQERAADWHLREP